MAVLDVDLAGKYALVTGGGAGIGLETARLLVRAGASVLLAVRDVVAAEAAAATLRGSGGNVDVARLDLADLTSVRAFVRDFGRRRLDLLINNAGVMATPLGFTAQGFELQLGTNHLGHFALTLGLLPCLQESSASRVVTVSSSLHKRGSAKSLLATLESDPRYERRKYAPFGAYGDSKLANVLFTRALSRRLPSQVTAFALHPGVIPTRLTRSLGVGGAIFRALGRPFMKSPEDGAFATGFAATDAKLAAHSGGYLRNNVLTKASATALDDELAEHVWRRSEALVKQYA